MRSGNLPTWNRETNAQKECFPQLQGPFLIFKIGALGRAVEAWMVPSTGSPTIPALGRWEREHQEFKVTFGYIASLNPAWETWGCVSKRRNAHQHPPATYPTHIPKAPQHTWFRQYFRISGRRNVRARDNKGILWIAVFWEWQSH